MRFQTFLNIFTSSPIRLHVAFVNIRNKSYPQKYCSVRIKVILDYGLAGDLYSQKRNNSSAVLLVSSKKHIV